MNTTSTEQTSLAFLFMYTYCIYGLISDVHGSIPAQGLISFHISLKKISGNLKNFFHQTRICYFRLVWSQTFISLKNFWYPIYFLSMCSINIYSFTLYFHYPYCIPSFVHVSFFHFFNLSLFYAVLHHNLTFCSSHKFHINIFVITAIPFQFCYSCCTPPYNWNNYHFNDLKDFVLFVNYKSSLLH